MVRNSGKTMNTRNKTKALQTLSEAGLRNTTQRALIISAIREGKGHLDAYEVYRRIQTKQPRLSLSTVYRTIRALKKAGVVDEVHFDEEHHHYEMKPATEHHHLLCLGCGRVIEFKYPLALLVKANVPEAREFEIVGSEVRMTGYCPTCRRNQK